MAIPIIIDWEKYYQNPHEGLGSSYERVVLNDLILATAKKHGVKTALESPSFGFTGISGINLMALADSGVKVTLQDNDPRRLELIQQLWNRLERPLQTELNPDFRGLKHPDKAFDLSFSFSALWFVPDLKTFLAELSRVTAKVIFISVPNRSGLGYKLQLRDYSPQKYPELKLSHIDPASIISLLGKLGWKLESSGYFDCPPWPDIGMTKEEFLGKWLGIKPASKAKESEKAQKYLSILSHYEGNDPDFEKRMRKLQWFEKIAPNPFKMIWAHHLRLVFSRRGGSEK
ncbi:MAG: class I SAM-dependent methyltransferase [Candidatus Cloacimonetes bacterium]|nr:class I SAM-dependent methyltransferase [Candidatus Cloacimonadota bacterium]